jgi:hypothetical protein
MKHLALWRSYYGRQHVSPPRESVVMRIGELDDMIAKVMAAQPSAPTAFVTPSTATSNGIGLDAADARRDNRGATPTRDGAVARGEEIEVVEPVEVIEPVVLASPREGRTPSIVLTRPQNATESFEQVVDDSDV